MQSSMELLWTSLKFELFILLLISIHSSSSDVPDDINNIFDQNEMLPPVLIPIPTTTKPWNNLTKISIDFTTTTTGYLIRTNQVFSLLSPHTLQRTLHQAKTGNCVAAINGGPFNADGNSSGPLVVQGQVQNNHKTSLIGFGISKQHSSYILGNYDQFPSLPIWNFVSGFGWLVHQGKNVAARSEVAPRTAIGLDQDLNLLLFVADGCEKCGLSLSDLAQVLLKEFGAIYAINMDGGASSTMVHNGKVVNQPTCLDYVRIPCQRPVATVLCIKKTF